MKLLAVRNDRLGDFMLAWPALQGLAMNLPDARLTVLAREYTAPLAGLCAGVADVLCDPGIDGELASARALARLVRPGRFDASVSLFSRFDSALALAMAGIPMRVAPATKIARFLYTHRLRQRRSRSLKPEFVYNLELAEFALRLLGVARPERPGPPYLRFPDAEVASARRDLETGLDLPAGRPIAFLHPGHGGSAPPPPAGLFARIGSALVEEGASLVLSQGPADEARVAGVAAALRGIPHAVYRSRSGLVDFARRLACADVFVSGSTGPLHVAGALDRPTAAFYPRRRSASALRWQTLGADGHRLAFSPPPGAGEDDFAAIDPEPVVADVRRMFREARDRGDAATGRRI